MTQKRLFLSLLCLFLLAACSGTPTPTVTPTATSVPTAIPISTGTVETTPAPTAAETTAATAAILSTPEATSTETATVASTAEATSAASASASLDSAPAQAVSSYLSAMVVDDESKMPQLICPSYEAGAKTDFDSFGAIGGVKLDNVSCTTTSINGDNATVVCTGSIDYTYNGESNTQDLSGNTYSAQQVDGEWTMCGYK